MLQCGIGDYMVSRLKGFGVDLSDQTIQQKRARKGSIDGSLATLDLSSASDTISYWLVKFLLPREWFELLSMARCRTYVYKGNEFPLAHFSSMGNGYTFPLESAIFWSLCRSVHCHSGVTVFGDDIVINTGAVPAVKELLSFCGFTVNDEKSHTTGSFRESCGADYLFGIDVRPCYLKEPLSDQVLYTFHNFFAARFDDEITALIRENLICEQLYGPQNYGDGHLHTKEWPSFVNRRIRRRGYGGVLFSTYRLKGEALPSIYPGDYVTPLYLCYRSGTPKGDVWYEEKASCLMYLKDGRYLLDIPCVSGYEKVSIYTFEVR